jgi:hypothetical protein
MDAASHSWHAPFMADLTACTAPPSVLSKIIVMNSELLWRKFAPNSSSGRCYTSRSFNLLDLM